LDALFRTFPYNRSIDPSGLKPRFIMSTSRRRQSPFGFRIVSGAYFLHFLVCYTVLSAKRIKFCAAFQSISSSVLREIQFNHFRSSKLRYSHHQNDVGQFTPRRSKAHSNLPPHQVKVNTAGTNKKFNKNVHKKSVISSHQQAQSSIDRLRVDLIRSKLSVKMAEEKTTKLEAELKEMKRKYEKAQKSLEGEKYVGSKTSNLPLSNGNKLQQSPKPAPRKPSLQTGQGAPAISVSSSSEKFSGNGFDSLPPFAAALAANAEREEMEKRRRLGLVEECDSDIDYLDLDAPDDNHAVLTYGQAPVDIEGEHTTDLAPMPAVESLTEAQELTSFRSSEERLSSLIDEKKKMNSTGNYTVVFDNVSSIIASVGNVSSDLLNGHIIMVDEISDPISTNENDDIYALRQKCVLLTNQRNSLQRKLSRSEELRRAQAVELKTSMTSERVLRGLQADWHRGLCEKRKEMENQKEEWERILKEKERQWEREKDDLVCNLEAVERERDSLLMDRKDLKVVMGLFYLLLRDRVSDVIAEGKNRLLPESNSTLINDRNCTSSISDSLSNRMISVGGATIQPKVTHDMRVTSMAGAFIGKMKSLKDRVLHLRVFMGLKMNASTSHHITSTSTSQSPPLLVTKKRRRSRLYCPETVFEPRIPGHDSSVPKFLRSDE